VASARNRTTIRTDLLRPPLEQLPTVTVTAPRPSASSGGGIGLGNISPPGTSSGGRSAASLPFIRPPLTGSLVPLAPVSNGETPPPPPPPEPIPELPEVVIVAPSRFERFKNFFRPGSKSGKEQRDYLRDYYARNYMPMGSGMNPRRPFMPPLSRAPLPLPSRQRGFVGPTPKIEELPEVVIVPRLPNRSPVPTPRLPTIRLPMPIFRPTPPPGYEEDPDYRPDLITTPRPQPRSTPTTAPTVQPQTPAWPELPPVVVPGYPLPYAVPAPVVVPSPLPTVTPSPSPNPSRNPAATPQPRPTPTTRALPRPTPRAAPVAEPRTGFYSPILTAFGLPQPTRPIAGPTARPAPMINPFPLPFAQPQPQPRTQPPGACECEEKKPKKPKKAKQPRQKCYKGTYIERSKSLSKSPKEEIPCQ